jgi:hypothetical protein
MTRTLALALGLVLGMVAAAQAQQKDLTRTRPSSAGTSDAGATGPGIPGGSSISSTPGGTMPMGAATQNASPRPSLGPSLGPDLKDSLSSGKTR